MVKRKSNLSRPTDLRKSNVFIPIFW